MAALDFPSNPTVGQQYAAPNGVTYLWDGAAWVVTGGPPGQLWTGTATALTPTDATKNVTLVGTGSGTTITLGTATAKGRLETLNANSGAVGILANRDWATNAQDDATRPSWACLLNPVTDNLAVQRSPAGSTTQAGLMTLDNGGNLTLTGVLAGPGVTKSGLRADAGGTYAAWTANDPFAPQDSTRNSWALWGSLATSGSVAFNIYYRAANAGAGSTTTPFILDNAGNITILGATATKASGTTWANPSDERIKKNIAPYVQGLAAIVALDPKTFEFNGLGGSQDGMPGIGLIAQDVLPVMPEMVSVTPTKLAPDDEAPVDLLTLDTSALILALVNAVKELDAEVAALKTATVGPLPANA